MSRHFHIQLRDMHTGKAIIASGGVCYVARAGSPRKRAIVDKDGVALSNPVALVRGAIDFHIADNDVTDADLFILTPGGQFVDVRSIEASGPNEINVDTSRRSQSFVIPFAIEDTTAATETLTGFVIPAKSEMLPVGLGIDVVTLDSTEDIDVGTDSGDSGDADGFMDGVLLTAAGFKKPSLLTSADTMGAELSVQDSANAGDDAPEGSIAQQGKEISYTLSSGTDTGQGYIHLPYYLAA